ncbi:hypothetical protein P7K49_032890 [Saguinus oedipus]|uniref:Uncharacterized protein n=1 Tax=Saguinus oedipus TaxID=9490 RepID=A0ABQ9TQC2_SAGOE|nr:hypothetical protein P7K49_032890 [Saguinus oedipus]
MWPSKRGRAPTTPQPGSHSIETPWRPEVTTWAPLSGAQGFSIQLFFSGRRRIHFAIQCLETAFGVTVEDSDLALPQTLPEIFEAATTGKSSRSSSEQRRGPRSPRPPPFIGGA